jgi:hypothetical protein
MKTQFADRRVARPEKLDRRNARRNKMAQRRAFA